MRSSPPAKPTFADFQDEHGVYWREWCGGMQRPSRQRSENVADFDPPWGSGRVLQRVEPEGCSIPIYAESVKAYHLALARFAWGAAAIELGIWDGELPAAIGSKE